MSLISIILELYPPVFIVIRMMTIRRTEGLRQLERGKDETKVNNRGLSQLQCKRDWEDLEGWRGHG